MISEYMFRHSWFSAAAMAAKMNFESERSSEVFLCSSVFSVLDTVVGDSCLETVLSALLGTCWPTLELVQDLVALGLLA